MVESTASHFQVGWNTFKAHPRELIASVLVLFGSWVALEVAVIALHGLGFAIWLILHLAFFLFFSGLLLGFFHLALRIIDGEAPRLRELGAVLERGPVFFLASCIYLVGVIGGLVLLVLPGIYVAVRYSLFGHVLATGAASPIAALRHAGTLSSGRWWAVCLIVVMAVTMNLVGAAFLGVGLLLTFPISLLATSSFYRSLPQLAP